jgi:hypothetical protein
MVLGFVAGLVRAWRTKRSYTLPNIRAVGLVLLAFLPQALAFFVPATGRLVTQQGAAWILPISLGVLMLFAWFNRQLAGFWLLGLGLLLNFAVIAANGGLMPISPETLQVVHGAHTEIPTGDQAFDSKNIVLPVEMTRLEWLGDRFTVPDAWPLQFAYSLGDVFLAVGAFWALWAGGAPRPASADSLQERHSFSA